MPLAAIAFDPTYLVFDERDVRSREELERRIVLLTSARRLMVSSSAITILTSDETGAELVKNDFYPYHGRLNDLLHRLGLGSIYSANDVRVVVQKVIERSESLEEYLGVTFALYDDGATTSPDCTQCYAENVLLGVFLQVLGIISAGISANSSVRDTLRLSCPASSSWARLQFSGRLQATEPDLGLQEGVSEEIVLSHNYKAFVASLDGFTLWRRAENTEEFAFALFVGAMERGAGAGVFRNHSDVPVFEVGSAFAASLGNHQAMGKGRFSKVTYGTALSVICGNAGQAMWRGGPQGGKQIRRPDGALAWRSHVTARHEALRLMYWTIEGKIEFANVGVKNELVIEEGSGRVWSSMNFVEV